MGPGSVALGLHILRRLLVSSELFSDWLKRRIKLHKAVFDCSMVFVTLPASGFGIDAGRFALFIEIEHRRRFAALEVLPELPPGNATEPR